MKKVLLGTTALLAAGMFAGPALGQAAAARTPMTATNFNLSLGGFATFRVEYQTESPTRNAAGDANNFAGTADKSSITIENPRKTAFEFDSELQFRGAATLANGVKAGWTIELETGGQELLDLQTTAENADLIDDNFMYVEGRFGKATMGGFSVNSLDIGLARTFTSATAIDLYDAATDTTLTGAGNNRATFTSSIVVSNGRNRLQWEPPSMAGFRFVLAFAPDLSGENSVRPTQQDDLDAAQNDIYAATQWAGSIAGNRTRASAAYGVSTPETISGRYDPDTTQVSNNARWRLGADVQVGKILVGGFYKSQKRNAISTLIDEDQINWGIGATYTMGTWEFGAAWEQAKAQQLDTVTNGGGPLGTGSDKAKRWDVGANYTGLGNGRTVRVGWRQEKWEDNLDDVDDEANTRTLDVRYEWDVGPGLEFDVGYQNYRYLHHTGFTDEAPRKTAHGVMVQTKLTF